VFDPDFAHGLAFDEIMKEAKRWLQKNVFTSVEILYNMDICGGTLNYEGLSILNDVKAAAYKGKLKRIQDCVTPMPPCLQRVARILEKEGDRVCPFKMLNTEFGEGLEFDYARTTCLVINAFGLESTGRTHPINISTPIYAAKVTKNLLHTSAGLKMSDPIPW
jgi:hypothetical protein